jgi:hypothetical protein
MVVRWRQQEGEQAPEVEFFHHWPKHEHLSPEQLRWFLYWRTLWEHGHVQKTSLSYMMIHIYELLSLEYLQDPERAVERLIEFYSDFHDIQPKLDTTLVRWIGDLYLKMGQWENALYWYTKETKGNGGDLYEKLSWYRFGGLDIPMRFLQKIGGLQKSQFYRDRMPEIEAEVEKMVHQAFRTFYRLEGVHPLDRFARFTEETVLYLFSSTPVHEKFYLDGFRRYEYAGGFVHWVKNCLRYAENLLRRTEGKPPLKCDESVAPYFQDIADQYPARAVPPKPRKAEREEETAEVPMMARELPEEPIELDLSLVRSLSEETDWLVEMMSEGEAAEPLALARPEEKKPPVAGEPAETDDALDDTARGVAGGAATAAASVGASMSNPLGSLFADGDAEDVDEFLSGLPDGEQALVRLLTEQGGQERRSLAEWLKGRRMFLDATVMRINEAALEAGLEAVLEEEDEEIRLSEEYEDAVREWAQAGE